jgi:2'-5' RNA ligase
MRLFIASPVVPCRAFSLATQSLCKTTAGVRPVPGDSWHITLRFLGEVDDFQLVAATMHDALAGVAAVPAAVRGVGAFPKPGAARVAWAAVDAPGLAQVAERLCDATASIGNPPGTSTFVPHVTLARLKHAGDLTQWIEQYESTWFFQGDLNQVVLFSSKLTRQGPVYSRELVVELG